MSYHGRSVSEAVDQTRRREEYSSSNNGGTAAAAVVGPTAEEVAAMSDAEVVAAIVSADAGDPTAAALRTDATHLPTAASPRGPNVPRVLTRADAASLAPGFAAAASATDGAVAWYLWLLQRHSALDADVETLRRVWVFPPQLLPRWEAGGRRVDAVADALPAPAAADVLGDFDALLFPVPRTAGRWALLAAMPAADGGACPVVFYDPLSVFDEQESSRVIAFLRALAAASAAHAGMDFRARAAPLENPGPSNLGVFMLAAARAIVMKEPPPEAARIERLRTHLCREVLSDRLLPMDASKARQQQQQQQQQQGSAVAEVGRRQSIATWGNAAPALEPRTPVAQQQPVVSARTLASPRTKPAAAAPPPQSPEEIRLKLAAEGPNLVASEVSPMPTGGSFVLDLRYAHAATLLPGSAPCLEAMRWYLWLLQRTSAGAEGWKKTMIADWNPELRINISMLPANIEVVLFPRVESDFRRWTFIAVFTKLQRVENGVAKLRALFFDPLSVFDDRLVRDASASVGYELSARLLSPKETVPARAVASDLGPLVLSYARSLVTGEAAVELKYLDQWRISAIREILANKLRVIKVVQPIDYLSLEQRQNVPTLIPQQSPRAAPAAAPAAEPAAATPEKPVSPKQQPVTPTTMTIAAATSPAGSAHKKTPSRTESELSLRLAAERDKVLRAEMATLFGKSFPRMVQYNHLTSLLPGVEPSWELARWYLWMILRHSLSTPGARRAWVFDPDIIKATASVNIFREFDVMLFPQNHDGHWTLAAAFCGALTELGSIPVLFFDPQNTFSADVSEAVLEFVRLEREKYHLEAANLKLRCVPMSGRYMAEDVADNGIYVLWQARSIVTGGKMGIDRSLITQARYHMIREVLANKFIPVNLGGTPASQAHPGRTFSFAGTTSAKAAVPADQITPLRPVPRSSSARVAPAPEPTPVAVSAEEPKPAVKSPVPVAPSSPAPAPPVSEAQSPPVSEAQPLPVSKVPSPPVVLLPKPQKAVEVTEPLQPKLTPRKLERRFIDLTAPQVARLIGTPMPERRVASPQSSAPEPSPLPAATTTATPQRRPFAVALPLSSPLAKASPWMRHVQEGVTEEVAASTDAIVREEDVSAMIVQEGDRLFGSLSIGLNGKPGAKLELTYAQIATLLPGKQPCAEVVRWYAAMLQKKGESSWKTSWMFDPVFMERWTSRHDLSYVAEYTSGANIFEDAEVVLFPVLAGHWVLLAAFPKNATQSMIMPVLFLDPLGENDAKVGRDVLSFLDAERARLGIPRIVLNLRNVGLPQSFLDPELVDCGVALLAHMRSVLDGSKVGLEIVRLRRMRFHIIQEILANDLLPITW